MLSESRLLRRISNEEVWGWPFAIFTLVFFALISLFTDVLSTGVWDARWVAVNVVTYVEIFLLGMLLNVTLVMRIKNQTARFWISISMIAILGAVKNYSVGFVSVWLGLPDNASWQMRVFGGAIMGLLMLYFFATIFGSRLEHSAAMKKLSKARASLLNHRATAEMLVEAEREKLLDETRGNLLPKLSQIQRLVQSREQISDAVDDLRDLIATQIRPMSKELRQRAEILSSIEVSDTSKPKYFVRYFVWNTLYRPGFAIVILLATFSLLLQIFLGVGVTWIGFVVAGIASASLLLLKLVIPKKGRISRANSLVLTPLLAMVITLPAVYGGFELVGPSRFQLTVLSLLFLVGVPVWSSTLSEVLDADRRVSEIEASRDIEDLERELTLFDQQLWLARRNWGMLLHGTVQAAITAAITRLSAIEKLEDYQYELVNQDLTRALEALETTPQLEIDLQKFTTELTATWSGIAEVTWRFSERASRALQRDSSARMCVNEIAKEAVSNAVRHGDATAVRIEVERTDDEMILIEVSNDGKPPRANFELGVGSQMLDELTQSWNLSHDRKVGRTVLRASFPVSLGNLANA